MPTGQIRILLIEDDEVSAQAARIMLDRLGCQVDLAANGEEAIELFRKVTYDLILMDWQMPQMDGFETTARIRGMSEGHVTPIVGTTASMGRSECLAAGMNDVMPKPYQLEKLRLQLLKWTHWDENLRTAAPR